MAKCIVFCAGGFDALSIPIGPEDLVIAADGGILHAQKLGIHPDLILGDFDSLGYVPGEAQVFPVEKDDTDAMLAVREGLDRGFREFILYGSLDGPRLDHTIANLQTLQFLADHGAVGYLVGLNQTVTLIRNETVSFPAEATGILSLFCMVSDARGVTITGLYYPLEKGTLTPGFPLGVSNHFTGNPASITVTEGSLLCIYDRENGFPVRHEKEEPLHGY